MYFFNYYFIIILNLFGNKLHVVNETTFDINPSCLEHTHTHTHTHTHIYIYIYIYIWLRKSILLSWTMTQVCNNRITMYP